MRKRPAVFALIFLLCCLSSSFAAWDKKPQFRWTQLYRYDLRQDNHRLYSNRVSLDFHYRDKNNNSLCKLAPFFEIRRNIDKGIWERKELGIELGRDIFSWLYLGEAIQKGWMKEDYRYYTNYETRDYTEAETRLCLSHNLLSGRHLKLNGFVFNEYTYDFNQEAQARNELGAGLIVPVGKYIETNINWRHIDRVHYYDSDVLEAAFTLVF